MKNTQKIIHKNAETNLFTYEAILMENNEKDILKQMIIEELNQIPKEFLPAMCLIINNYDYIKRLCEDKKPLKPDEIDEIANRFLKKKDYFSYLLFIFYKYLHYGK